MAGLDIRVILVEPKYEGNIGSVARVMRNLGYDGLSMVNPPDIGDTAMAMAVHARELLEKAYVTESLEDAIKGSNVVIGTTAKPGIMDGKSRSPVRAPFLTPSELRELLRGKTGTASILIGRDDVGLNNEELEICDIIVHIPTSKEYPVMNISHALTIILYELIAVRQGMSGDVVGVLGQPSGTSLLESALRCMGGNVFASGRKLSMKEEREQLLNHQQRILESVNYPAHRVERTIQTLRRIYGRANLTSKEIRTLCGILRRTEWKIRNRDS